MASKNDVLSTGEHDWQSPIYVDEWIRRDLQHDEERLPRLREMLSLASIPPSAAIDVLDVGGGYGIVTEELLRIFPHAR
jgi:trans-aconitate methyltransferase